MLVKPFINRIISKVTGIVMFDNYETQNAIVLNHIKEKGYITSKDAHELYGIRRLSGRIYDLRKMGYPILTRMIKGKSRTGRVTKYAEYFLDK